MISLLEQQYTLLTCGFRQHSSVMLLIIVSYIQSISSKLAF